MNKICYLFFNYRDIASAIKDLLEAVNVVFKNNEAFRRPEHKRVRVLFFTTWCSPPPVMVYDN